MHRLPKGAVPSAVLLSRLAAEAGRPLEGDLQRAMEHRLGHGLDRVRIHAGPWATRAAASLGARAFTLGHHVVLGANVPDFASPAGTQLLAHELVHTVQQRHVNLDACGPAVRLGDPDSPHEHRAQDIAAAPDTASPGGPIVPDDGPAIRRALAIDVASAKLTANKGASAAAVKVGSENAFLHCTTNVNLSVADGVPGRETTGNMITYAAEVAFNANATSQADRNELLLDWELLFVQTSETILNEYEYAGRLASEGSIRIDVKPGFVPNPCLDANERLSANFPFLQNDSRTTTPPVGAAARYVVKIEAGDNPHGLIPLQRQNLVASATNFMFKARRDERFVVQFVARNLKRRQTHLLAHIKWRINWDAELRWGLANSKRVVPSGQPAIDVDTTFTAGAPTDPKVLAIVRNPQKPTANELDGRASDAAFRLRTAPFFQAFANRHIPVPADFFEEFSQER
jgi:hypothetical protein